MHEGIFCPELRNCCSFCSILTLDKFEGADFKNDKRVLKFSPKKYPNKSFFPEVRDFSFFCKILQLGKFEGADLKYENSV